MGTLKRWGIILAAACSLVGVLAALTADAQISGPCAETVAKFCRDVTPGGGRIMKCLAEHRDDQSISCKDWLEDQNKSLEDLKGACSREIARLCGGAADGVQLYRCLDDNYVSLLSDCRAKLREIKDRLQ